MGQATHLRALEGRALELTRACAAAEPSLDEADAPLLWAQLVRVLARAS